MVLSRLNEVKAASYIVIKSDEDGSYNKDHGTGFFISENGCFVTAKHVIEKRTGELWEKDKIHIYKPNNTMYNVDEVIVLNDLCDIVLLKIDSCVVDNFLEIDYNLYKEGTEVYSFGYPKLNYLTAEHPNISERSFYPRITWTRISSHLKDVKNNVPTIVPTRHYILDRPLLPGNSGGPIISSKTGRVFALCNRDQRYNLRLRTDEQKYSLPGYTIALSLIAVKTEISRHI